MKTRAEVEDLKAQWLTDPCWDIYATEGYGDYESELIVFQQAQEDQWARAEEASIRVIMERYECNRTMAQSMKAQERCMARLEQRITALEQANS